MKPTCSSTVEHHQIERGMEQCITRCMARKTNQASKIRDKRRRQWSGYRRPQTNHCSQRLTAMGCEVKFSQRGARESDWWPPSEAGPGTCQGRSADQHFLDDDRQVGRSCSRWRGKASGGITTYCGEIANYQNSIRSSRLAKVTRAVRSHR